MGTDTNPVLVRQSHCFPDQIQVPGMSSTGNIGLVNKWHHGRLMSGSFSKIAV
jgi:hypothetical protein